MKFFLLSIFLIISISCSKNISYEYRKNSEFDPSNNINSYFTLDKKLISPKLPVYNNKLTFHALNKNNQPITGLNVKIKVSPDLSSDEILTLTETSPGIYDGYIAKDKNYDLNIDTNSIPFFTNRHIAFVNVVNDTFCFNTSTESLVSWTLYNESGSGTMIDPYKICTAEQLKDLSNHSNSLKIDTVANDKFFELKREILDLNDFINTNEFIISDNPLEPFTGSFNGLNNEIRNFKSSNNEISFFKYLKGATIKNLSFSYKYENTNASKIGGMIDTIQTSTTNTLIDNINIKGSIISNNQEIEIGGLVRKASSNNLITISNVKLDLNINSSGSIGLLVNDLKGVGATMPIVDKINAKATIKLKNLNTNTNSKIGGLVNLLENASIFNSYSNIQLNDNTKTLINFGGIASEITDSVIENTYSLGSLNIYSINYSGGLVSIQTNSQIKNSFSLVNMTGNECLDFCGKVLGLTNGGINTQMLQLMTHDNTVFNFNILNTSQTIVETSTNTSNYFYNKNNLPLSNWDFSTIWTENLTDYPSL